MQAHETSSGAEITVKDVSLTIGKKRLLESVNLNIGGGSFTAVIGPSGAGKSTILSILSGRVTPSTGNITIIHTYVHVNDNLGKIRIFPHSNTRAQTPIKTLAQAHLIGLVWWCDLRLEWSH